jgi:hypothetical protein
MKIPEKRSYEKPELVAHGSIATITQGSSTGTRLDVSFPSGTFFSDLTFS